MRGGSSIVDKVEQEMISIEHDLALVEEQLKLADGDQRQAWMRLHKRLMDRAVELLLLRGEDERKKERT